MKEHANLACSFMKNSEWCKVIISKLFLKDRVPEKTEEHGTKTGRGIFGESGPQIAPKFPTLCMFNPHFRYV